MSGSHGLKLSVDFRGQRPPHMTIEKSDLPGVLLQCVVTHGRNKIQKSVIKREFRGNKHGQQRRHNGKSLRIISSKERTKLK